MGKRYKTEGGSIILAQEILQKLFVYHQQMAKDQRAVWAFDHRFSHWQRVIKFP